MWYLYMGVNKMEPKTWLPSEIRELIEKEMRAYTHDCSLRRIPISYQDMADCVVSVLAEKGLIEYQP
jgi:hypothetical protein